MKTTLTLITIITSLFFSGCANNNRTEDWNARRAANASLAERYTRLQKDLIWDPFTLKFVPANADVFAGTSSARFKKDIKPMDKTSETVLALKPVTFHYKSDTKGTPQFGLIAEEVAAVNPDLVVRDKEGKPYTVRYEAVNAMLLNEFLKEHRTVQDLKATAEKQQATIALQEGEIKALTASVREQAAQIQKVSAQIEASRPAPQTVVDNH